MSATYAIRTSTDDLRRCGWVDLHVQIDPHQQLKVVPFRRSAAIVSDRGEWPVDPDTQSITRARLGNKLQRLAQLRPSTLTIIEMMADKFLAEALETKQDI